MKLRSPPAVSLLIVLFLTGMALFFWKQRRSATVFETSPIVRGDIEERVTAIGVLQPRSFVDVGAQVSGVIQRLLIESGSKVNKGDLLIEIDPSVQQSTVDAGRAALAGLRSQLVEQKAQHQLALRQYDRQIQLSRQDATRAEDLQTAEAAAAVAAARVETIVAQIAQMEATQRADEVRLGYTRIYAPMSGTVVSLEAREGQTLNATYQTPSLLRIANLSTMTVWTQVSEADVKSVKPGMAAYFTTLGGERRRWDGKVRQVLPAPHGANKATEDATAAGNSPKVVVYTALFDVDNADGDLMPQMTAQVSFIHATARDVLIAPLSALNYEEARSPEDSGVFTARVLGKSGVETRSVTIGIQDRIHAEIKFGLEERELLITPDLMPSEQTEFTP